MSNNPTLIAGFEDFLSYIKNQDAIIKTHREADEQIQKLNKELVALKDAEIVKLREENTKLKESNEQIQKLNKELVALQDAEIVKLREENENLKQQLGGTEDCSWDYYTELLKLREENTKLKKEVEEQREEIKYSTLLTAEVVQDQCPEEFKHLCTDEKAQEICDKYKEGVASYLYQVLDDTCEADIDYEDELYESEDEDDDADKYDGDDWGWVYGKNIVEQEEYKEVVLVISGGGDHWENYIMSPTMNYIKNKDGKHPQRDKVLVQSSCGKYVSFQDKDYVPDDGECICEYEHAVVE